jgi:hypothetical protein
MWFKSLLLSLASPDHGIGRPENGGHTGSTHSINPIPRANLENPNANRAPTRILGFVRTLLAAQAESHRATGDNQNSLTATSVVAMLLFVDLLVCEMQFCPQRPRFFEGSAAERASRVGPRERPWRSVWSLAFLSSMLMLLRRRSRPSQLSERSVVAVAAAQAQLVLAGLVRVDDGDGKVGWGALTPRPA